MAGKESNTKSLTRSIKMIVEIVIMPTMTKVLMAMILIVMALLTRVSSNNFLTN